LNKLGSSKLESSGVSLAVVPLFTIIDNEVVVGEAQSCSFEIRPGLIFAIYVRVRGVGLTVVTTQILMSRVIRIFFA
jgi:hypothetical protein